MADTALDISGSLSFDGPKLFTSDYFPVDLVIKDPDGAPLSGAAVTVALMRDGAQQYSDSGTTASDGSARLTLQPPSKGPYAVLAKAETSSRSGYAEIGDVYAFSEPPLTVGGVQGQLQLVYTTGSNLISSVAT